MAGVKPAMTELDAEIKKPAEPALSKDDARIRRDQLALDLVEEWTSPADEPGAVPGDW
jgi:hypothetical protein